MERHKKHHQKTTPNCRGHCGTHWNKMRPLVNRTQSTKVKSSCNVNHWSAASESNRKPRNPNLMVKHSIHETFLYTKKTTLKVFSHKGLAPQWFKQRGQLQVHKGIATPQSGVAMKHFRHCSQHENVFPSREASVCIIFFGRTQFFSHARKLGQSPYCGIVD